MHARRNFLLRARGLLPIVCPVTDGSDLAGSGSSMPMSIWQNRSWTRTRRSERASLSMRRIPAGAFPEIACRGRSGIIKAARGEKIYPGTTACSRAIRFWTGWKQMQKGQVMKFLKVGFLNSTRMSMSLDAFYSPRASEPKRPILLTANLALMSPAWLLRRSIISMLDLWRKWFSSAKSIVLINSYSNSSKADLAFSSRAGRSLITTIQTMFSSSSK